MMDKYPNRAFDVGIAEQHAVTLAAGMATQGKIVFCNIYSTFLQRAYDQVIHDVCLQDLPVIFCLDRAGLVGEDGATHHGIFDLAYLRCIPNIILFSPRNEIELRNILFTAQLGLKHPIAIRYPRGRGRIIHWEQGFSPIEIGTGSQLKKGSKIAVLSMGTMADNVSDALNLLGKDTSVSHYDLRFLKPLDTVLLHSIFAKYPILLTVEDGVIAGGFGSAVSEFATLHNYTNQLHILGLSDAFPDQGSILQLQELAGISPQKIADVLNSLL